MQSQESWDAAPASTSMNHVNNAQNYQNYQDPPRGKRGGRFGQSSCPPPVLSEQKFGPFSASAAPPMERMSHGPPQTGMGMLFQTQQQLTSGYGTTESPSNLNPASLTPTSPSHPPPAVSSSTLEDLTCFLINLQTFEGSWEVSPSLLSALKISGSDLKHEAINVGVEQKVFATAVVIAVFEQKLREFEGSWDLVVEKAREWLSERSSHGLVARANEMVK